MGEIADMMLDGTMDFETGEWNFEGEDGPGFPMTGAQAAEFARESGAPPYRRASGSGSDSRQLRSKVGIFGVWRDVAEALEAGPLSAVEIRVRVAAGDFDLDKKVIGAIFAMNRAHLIFNEGGVYFLKSRAKRQLARARAADGVGLI